MCEFLLVVLEQSPNHEISLLFVTPKAHLTPACLKPDDICSYFLIASEDTKTTTNA